MALFTRRLWAVSCAGIPMLVGAQGAAPTQVLQRPPAVVVPTAADAVLPPSNTGSVAAVPSPGTATRLTVKSFAIQGATVISEAALQARLTPYLNRPIGLIELYQAADQITALYHAAGYQLASTVLPEQDVTDGRVNLLVLEGRVAEVSASGLRSYSETSVLAFLPTLTGAVYQGSSLQEGLLRMQELPGLTARAVLRPGTQFGTTNVTVEAREKPMDVELFFDNAGREVLGERRMGLSAYWNNPSGAGDRLGTTLLRSTNDRLQYGFASYSIPVNSLGTRAQVSVGVAKFDLSDAVAGLQGSNQTQRLELIHPLRLNSAERWVTSLAWMRLRADTDLVGVPIGASRLSTAEIASAYNYQWQNRAVSAARVSLGSNFNSNGDDAQLLRLEADAQHLQPLGKGLQLLGRINGVYSPKALPDVQQMTLGGPASVRAYAPAEARGDRGYQVSVNLRRPVALPYAFVLTPRCGLDHGQVFSADDRAASLTLSGMDCGFDVSRKNWVLRADYAVPLQDRVQSDGRDDGRFYGAFAINF